MHVHESRAMQASPDAVWAVGGDVANVARFVPAIEESHLEGEIRHATFAGAGGSARERIIEVDPAARAYVYEYLDGPLALSEYRSRFAVTPDGDGRCIVTWDSDLTASGAEEEAELGATVATIYAVALEELARIVEA